MAAQSPARASPSIGGRQLTLPRWVEGSVQHDAVAEAPCTGPGRPQPLRSDETRVDPNHARMKSTILRLNCMRKANSRLSSAANLGLALQALALDLKEVAAVLLELQTMHEDAAAEASLQAAVYLCMKVHREEVMPGARYFGAHAGASAKEWADALAGSRVSTGRCGPDSPARRTASVTTLPPRAADVEALHSDAQRAVLRSLHRAAELGVQEAAVFGDRLCAQFCELQRLHRYAAAARAHAHAKEAASGEDVGRRRRQNKARMVQSGASSARWGQPSPWRCRAERIKPDEDGTQLGWMEPGKVGYQVLMEREDEIARLVRDPEAEAQQAAAAAAAAAALRRRLRRGEGPAMPEIAQAVHAPRGTPSHHRPRPPSAPAAVAHMARERRAAATGKSASAAVEARSRPRVPAVAVQAAASGSAPNRPPAAAEVRCERGGEGSSGGGGSDDEGAEAKRPEPEESLPTSPLVVEPPPLVVGWGASTSWRRVREPAPSATLRGCGLGAEDHATR